MNTPKILFENDDIVVIDKPVGIAVHGDGVKTDPTIASWFVAAYPDAAGVGESMQNRDGVEIERAGVVHRLDRDTSGVMVLAKTQEAFLHLKGQFQDRTVKKEYRALVYGHLREKWGTIDRPIGRNAKDFRLRSAQRGAKGALREAQTDWEILGTGEYEGEAFSYLALKPKTGRMHQLRVHLKAVDRPIVGDVLYAGAKREQSNNLGLERLALHAYVLQLSLLDGSFERFAAPLPTALESAADKLHDPE